MVPSEPQTAPAPVNLAVIASELRQGDAFQREGHTARTLVLKPDLRVVLVVMKAGARIAEHRAAGTATVQTLSGHVRLHLASQVADLTAGRLLLLEAGLAHDVEAVVDSTFLLTLAWRAGQ